MVASADDATDVTDLAAVAFSASVEFEARVIATGELDAMTDATVLDALTETVLPTPLVDAVGANAAAAEAAAAAMALPLVAAAGFAAGLLFALGAVVEYGAACSLRASRRSFFCCMTRRMYSSLFLVWQFSRIRVRHRVHSSGPPASVAPVASPAGVFVEVEHGLVGAAARLLVVPPPVSVSAASDSSSNCRAREQRQCCDGGPAALLAGRDCCGSCGCSCCCWAALVVCAVHEAGCWQRTVVDATVTAAAAAAVGAAVEAVLLVVLVVLVDGGAAGMMAKQCEQRGAAGLADEAAAVALDVADVRVL